MDVAPFLFLVVVHHCEHRDRILVLFVLLQPLHEPQELLLLLPLREHPRQLPFLPIVGARLLIVDGRLLIVDGRLLIVDGRLLIIGGSDVEVRYPEDLEGDVFLGVGARGVGTGAGEEVLELGYVGGAGAVVGVHFIVKIIGRLLFVIIQIVTAMGKKIENYCLETVIGEGEFGKVYRATNEKTEQTVAIKVIKIEKYKMSPRLEEFTINEIQTLSKIEDTTHIVRFIEILKTANNVYFVYEFCNGGTLEALIKNTRYLPQDKALTYFKELLKAFKMLVKNNIMHRDIKPSNILLHNGVLKLADFGFCKPLKDARDLSQTMLGSPIYMAPEILKGELYTINADIWSLGVVLYEMLFGFCPFEERNIARLIDLIDSSNSITFPSHIKISKSVEDLIKRMLVKDHFKRISWEELFEYDFNPSVEPEQVDRQRGRSPFMKKQFNSLKTNENTNVLANANNYSTKNYSDPSRPLLFKKAESTPSGKSPLSDSENKMLKSLLEKRSRIKKGVVMVQELLKRNNSKLTVYICCFLMKKVKSKVKQVEKELKFLQADKENFMNSYDLRKIVSSLVQEREKVESRIVPFEEELKTIKEPQDILFMRYAEEEGLAQEKDGLVQLLEIDDFLQDGSSSGYMRMTKKELLDEYEKRVIRNE